MNDKNNNPPPLVLVVDDQETARFLAAEALRQAGFTVEEAGGGAEALVLIERSPPDLVLLDVVMPDMDGFAVCEAIRARPDTQHLPVLMMTGLDDEESIVRAYDTGATDFIAKPFKRIVLTQRVRHVLRARRSEEKVHQLAYFDSLTRLANRESFKERLGQAVALAKRHERLLSVLFLDLDDFKRVNDTLGHSVGDLLLKTAAERLLDCVRESDTLTHGEIDHGGDIVARLGGDEFIILLPEIERTEDAAKVARRILSVLSEPYNLAGFEVFITPSIGIAVFPEDAQDPGTLLKTAGTAMHSAKRGGKGLYQFYDESMNTATVQRLAMDNQLRKALDRDEFSLHYQPQMDVVTGRICGAEALLRWHNQDLGMVSPADFIPLAEESGLIVAIGEWVLRTACVRVKGWQTQGLALSRMAVNVSVLQFVQRGFVDLVNQVLRETGLAPHHLELEITESLLMKDVEGAIHTLRALKDLGVQLAIDDFGTGYSSLNYLKRFPIDRLKIDRSFVRDITSDPDDAAIATAVAAMARNMDLEVIAEGVETEAQLSFLKSKGCHEIQGYYFSRPLPPEELELLLRENLGSDVQQCDESSGQRTVLFLDDDARTVVALKKLMQKEGYQILTATRASQAFDALAKHRVEVVVSDYDMPEMNGVEFLKRVRKLSPTTVRIMLSGRSDMKSLIAAVNTGALYKFLEKPVSMNVLRDTLREAFLIYDDNLDHTAVEHSDLCRMLS